MHNLRKGQKVTYKVEAIVKKFEKGRVWVLDLGDDGRETGNGHLTETCKLTPIECCCCKCCGSCHN